VKRCTSLVSFKLSGGFCQSVTRINDNTSKQEVLTDSSSSENVQFWAKTVEPKHLDNIARASTYYKYLESSVWGSRIDYSLILTSFSHANSMVRSSSNVVTTFVIMLLST
jgi:hypothetical protein